MLKQHMSGEKAESNVQVTSRQDPNYNSEERMRADSFSLEFASSQWQRLVTNAEGLLKTLVRQGVDSDAKGQIEQWLFLKQECEDCFINDGTIIKDKVYSLDRIDEVTESDGKSVGQSESETEYSDSGAEIDDAVDLSQVESKRQDFAEKLESLINKFCGKTDALVSQCIGPVDPIDLPIRHPLVPSSSFNTSKNKRRKSILPSNPTESEKLPATLDSTKKEFDLHASLTQSKKKLKRLLKQLRKEEEHDGSKSEDNKRSKEKSKKSDKSSENDELKILKEGKKQAVKTIQHETGICLSDKLLRDEITNLRITRDFLVEQRKSLDAKFNRDKTYSHYEERRFLELDEAIEAVDTTIEYKNGSICGRISFEERDRDEGEQMLLDRLMKLSEPEMRFLLYKYFQKTIDLRESGRKMEQQIADLDHQVEAQAWKIQALGGALQQANAENERRLVMVHREHEEKLHLMFRHYTGTGTSSSADTKIDEPKALPSTSQNAIPQQNLRKLQGTSLPHTTKVTRQKNKLIIQQQTRKTKDY